MSVKSKGFTLIELIVGMVLATVVMTGVLKTVMSTQRNSQALAQRIDVQQTVRSSVQYLASTLRELNASGGDLLSISSNSLRFRGMRWVGFLCGPPVQVGSDVLLPLRTSRFYGVRRPDASVDSILLFRDGLTSTRMDDRWLLGRLQSVDTSVCSDGTDASRLRIGVNAVQGGADSVMTGVTEGAPVRAFHIVELATMTDAKGRSWVGRLTSDGNGNWSDIQPVIGPITGGGFELLYYDDADNITATPQDVASLALTVRAQSLERVQRRSGGYINDSLVTRVTLRNNRRY